MLLGSARGRVQSAQYLLRFKASSTKGVTDVLLLLIQKMEAEGYAARPDSESLSGPPIGFEPVVNALCIRC